MTIDAILTSPALTGMRAVRQWLVYTLVPRGNRTDKIPLHYSTAAPTSVNDPAGWTDAVTAAASARAWGPQFGVGFCFTADCGLWFVDVDSCLVDGQWSTFAQQTCRAFAGAAVEVSSSGRGLHLFGRGTVPPHASKNAEHHAELYHTDRFVALSGLSLSGDCNTDHTAALAWFAATYFPPRAARAADQPDSGPRSDWRGPESDDELIRRALQSRSAASVFGGGRASFADLWTADVTALARAYPDSGDRAYDASSADAALCAHLAFWTGCDQGRIDRLMRQSALVRDKFEREDYLPRTIANACAQQRDVLKDKSKAAATIPAVTAAAPVQSSYFVAASAGYIEARIENVFDALQSAESGIRIALDQFQEQLVMAGADQKWKPFTDADYGRLRAQFGRKGFKAISPEIMKTSVLMAADDNKFDTAIQWAESLRWDGIQRIDSALPTYYRTADTPYTRAVGAYLFTAFAARALTPGAQVDMVPVFVGLQGERKTSAVRALSPDPQFFSEINLKKIDDDNMARRVRGKLVGEIAELRGLAGRDQESVKAWITRREEQWRPVYREFEVTYPRRLVLIGTANEREFLDDPTGERRWLPVDCGAADVEAIKRDCEQLWAEGIVRFKANGVEWQDAERLAHPEHARFKVTDPWADAVETWLATQTGAPFKMADVCMHALRRSMEGMTTAETKRLGKVLRGMGCDRTERRIDGKVANVWVPPSSLSSVHMG